jgi:enediyne core biosynthesis thioesterase
MRVYEYRHIVSFEDTNMVGNVYYANHIRWQGRCREMFLKEYVPEVLAELQRDLTMVTMSVSCQYLGELFAFDEVTIRMRLREMVQNRITMHFEYWRKKDEREVLIAQGEQQIACMRREGDRLLPTPIPASLAAVLRLYAEA